MDLSSNAKQPTRIGCLGHPVVKNGLSKWKLIPFTSVHQRWCSAICKMQRSLTEKSIWMSRRAGETETKSTHTHTHSTIYLASYCGLFAIIIIHLYHLLLLEPFFRETMSFVSMAKQKHTKHNGNGQIHGASQTISPSQKSEGHKNLYHHLIINKTVPGLAYIERERGRSNGGMLYGKNKKNMDPCASFQFTSPTNATTTTTSTSSDKSKINEKTALNRCCM